MLPPTEHSHSGSDAESDAACEADLDADSATWGWIVMGIVYAGQIGGQGGGLE